MKLEIVPIDSVFPDPENANIHSIEQLHDIAESLRAFGQQKPIVVSPDTGIIIAGNGTYEAAKSILGWEKIAVVWTTLDDFNSRAYAIADNQLNRKSHWDFTILSEQIKSISEWKPDFNWDAIGFDEDEINPLLSHHSMSDDELDEFMENMNSDSLTEEKNSIMGKSIKLTKEQREVVNEAISAIKEEVHDKEMSEGRALELICADYLAGR